MGRAAAEVIFFAIAIGLALFGIGKGMYFFAKREAVRNTANESAILREENEDLRAEIVQLKKDNAQLNSMADEILTHLGESPGLFDLATVNERISNIIRAGRPSRK